MGVKKESIRVGKKAGLLESYKDSPRGVLGWS